MLIGVSDVGRLGFNLILFLMARKIFYPLLLIYVMALCMMVYSSAVWFDECMTMALIQGYDIKGIAVQLRYSSHPPLYYFILKCYSWVFGDAIPVMKLINPVIYGGIIALSYEHCRKLWDRKVASYMVLILAFMPILLNVVYELKMYIFSSLFLLQVGYYICKIAMDKREKWDVWFLTFWTICAIYTHYYTLLFVVTLHLGLYVYLLKKKQYREVAFLAVVPLLSFTPWVTSFLAQLVDKGEAVKDYHVMNQIVKMITYPFYVGDLTYKTNMVSVVGTLILLLFVLYLVLSAIFKKERIPRVLWLGAALPCVVILSAFVISCLKGEAYWYAKYMSPVFVLWAALLAYILAKAKRRVRGVGIVILCMAFGWKYYTNFNVNQNKGSQRMVEELENVYERFDGKMVLLDAYYLPSVLIPKAKLFRLEKDKLRHCTTHMLWNINMINSYENIDKELLVNGFWLLKDTRQKKVESHDIMLGDEKYVCNDRKGFEVTYRFQHTYYLMHYMKEQ